MLFEFDKQWVALSQGVGGFLEAADDYHGAVDSASEMAKSYVQCQSQQHGYPALLTQYKTLQTKRRMAISSLRSSFGELEKRLTLLANVLVDGGLLRTHMMMAAAELPETIATTIHGDLKEARHFFTEKGMSTIHEEMMQSMMGGLPPQLLAQTKSAFALANELAFRHGSMGLQKRETAVVAMHNAWQSVHNELSAFKSLLGEPHGDSSSFQRRLLAVAVDKLLQSSVQAPEDCASQGSVVWKALPASTGQKLLLVAMPGQALLFKAGSTKDWGWNSTAVKALKPQICERSASGAKWVLRAMRADDEHPSCLTDSGSSECNFFVDSKALVTRGMKLEFLDLSSPLKSMAL